MQLRAMTDCDRCVTGREQYLRALHPLGRDGAHT